jgi:hypothetical protein
MQQDGCGQCEDQHDQREAEFGVRQGSGGAEDSGRQQQPPGKIESDGADGDADGGCRQQRVERIPEGRTAGEDHGSERGDDGPGREGVPLVAGLSCKADQPTTSTSSKVRIELKSRTARLAATQ